MINGYYVIDSHCHIYPEKIASKAVAGTDKFYDAKSVGEGTVNDLLSRGEQAGIDFFIVQSVATTPHQVKSINEFIADNVKNNPEKLLGLGTLHPDSEDIKGDIEHLIELGLKGVKLHPDIQAFKIDDYRLLKIYVAILPSVMAHMPSLTALPCSTGSKLIPIGRPVSSFNL